MKCQVSCVALVGLCGIVSTAACGEGTGHDSTSSISISISSPKTETYVNGPTQVTVAVSGEVSRVELLVDDQVVAESAEAPFDLSWDASAEAETLHRLRAVAYGPGAEVQSSAEHLIIVDRTPPTLDIANLSLPYVFSGTETIELVSEDENELASLILNIDGVEQPGCTLSSCLVSWDTLTVADGPVEISGEAVDVAGNITTLVRPVVVVNDGTVLTFTDGSGSGSYSIPAQWASLDLHKKYHVDMPAGVTEIVAIAQWYDVSWQMQLDVGTGFCPDSGTTFLEDFGEGGQILLSHTAAEHGVTEFAEEQWFIHIGTGPDFDMDGHIDEGTYYALTFVVY